MPLWNIFNALGKMLGQVLSNTKEEAELYTRELGFGDSVDYAERPKVKMHVKRTPREKEFGLEDD